MAIDISGDCETSPGGTSRTAIGHWEVLAETGELYWSDEVYRIHGLEIGSQIDVVAAIKAYHPEDRNKVAEYVRSALEEKKDYQFDLRIIRSDGEIRHVRSTGVVRLSTSGKVHSVFGVFQDITEVIRTEERLRKNEALVRALIEHSPVAISIKDFDGRYTFVSPAFARYLNISPGQAIEQSVANALASGDMARLGVADQNVIRTGKALGRDEAFSVVLGSSTLLVTKFPIQHIDGSVIGVGTIGIDITEQQRAEKQLRLSAQRLEDIAEAASDWFWELDADLRFTYISDLYEEVAGVSPKLLLGKRPEEVYPRSARRQAEDWKTYFEAVRDHKDFREFIHDDFRQDGQRRVIRNTGKAIFTDDGEFAGYRGTSTDITELRVIEEALRERETMLNAVIENVPMSLSLKDTEGRFTLVNPGFERFHRVSAEEVLGKTFFDILPHEVAADAAAEDRQVLESGEPLRTDYSWPGHLGVQHELIFKFPLHPLDKGPITGVGVIALDVTEQKWAEDELRKSEERLTQAVQLAQLGHCIWDSIADRCLYCSEEYARIHGVSPEEYIARASTPGGIFNHPDDRDTYREAIEDLRHGEGFEMEYRVVTPNGEVRYAREVAKPLFDEDGTVVKEICTIQDITAVKMTEAHLVQAQKMEAVGQLTGGVAHDFNNLLAVIMGNTELLEEQLGPEDPALEEILRAAKRGAELTQRLLAFSRQQPLRPQVIDLGALVSSMSEMLTRTLGETVEIRIGTVSNLWSAVADPGQVENALLNLALNARDAMRGGGKLTIECINAQLDEAYVEEYPEAKAGDYVVLAVSDEGSGMTAQAQAHAFEPFFTTKEVGQGSGLGLSMVYGFAKQSGGQVTIYSEEGKGTTVKLYLPRAAEAPRREDVSEEQSVLRGGDEAILVIEDDAAVRALAVRMLDVLGYRVTAVPDAAAAHEALTAGECVDLVLCDVVLPGGTSGPEFADQARSTYPGLKVVFMSGYPAEASKRNGFLGSDQVLLNKPFQRQKLAKVLREALDRGTPE